MKLLKLFSRCLLIMNLITMTRAETTAQTAFEATSRTETKSISENKILVSIIDTGIDLNNPELRPYIWNNPGESGLDSHHRDKSSNGLDDDLNGYVDDVHGWNFVENSNNVQDFHGHGTHVSSMIINTLKKLNRDHRIEIQIVKYFHSESDSHNFLNASNNSFHYVSRFNPSLINYSGGGYTPSPEEKNILAEFENKNTLIITASGNHNNNNDIHPYYPASYHFKNLISVGSVGSSKTLSAFSNFGKTSVELFALGEAIPSFTLNNKVTKLSGTSQATANLSAFALYLIIESQQNDPQFIKQFLCEQTRSLAKLTEVSNCGKIILFEDLKKFRGKTFDAFNNAIIP